MKILKTDRAIIVAGILVLLVALAGLFMVTSISAAVSDCSFTESSILGESSSPNNKHLTHGRSQNLNKDL
tara:strand:+ start:161 stop:370 length:210 start_codon:yes stop_codon:yes gene_type:complete